MDKKDISHQAFSPRSLAAALGVSESSIKRWIDAGKIQVSKTAGGHRRVPLHAAVKFIREQGMEVLQPDVLGLPEHATEASYSDPSLVTADLLFDLFLSEHADQAASHLVRAFVAGASPAELFDGPVREANHRLGELWHDGEAGIFTEHRATQLFIQALAQIRMLMAMPEPDAPLAIGGAPANDPYYLPSAMVSMIFVSLGLREMNLGPKTPTLAFKSAVATTKADVVWISLSTKPDADARKTVQMVQEDFPEVTLLVGGRYALNLGDQLTGANTRHLSSMVELEQFLRQDLETSRIDGPASR